MNAQIFVLSPTPISNTESLLKQMSAMISRSLEFRLVPSLAGLHTPSLRAVAGSNRRRSRHATCRGADVSRAARSPLGAAAVRSADQLVGLSSFGGHGVLSDGTAFPRKAAVHLLAESRSRRRCGCSGSASSAPTTWHSDVIAATRNSCAAAQPEPGGAHAQFLSSARLKNRWLHSVAGRASTVRMQLAASTASPNQASSPHRVLVASRTALQACSGGTGSEAPPLALPAFGRGCVGSVPGGRMRITADGASPPPRDIHPPRVLAANPRRAPVAIDCGGGQTSSGGNEELNGRLRAHPCCTHASVHATLSQHVCSTTCTQDQDPRPTLVHGHREPPESDNLYGPLVRHQWESS